MTIYAAEPDLVDEADEDEPGDFVPHECLECGGDVPGSPEDGPVICARCSRYDYLI